MLLPACEASIAVIAVVDEAVVAAMAAVMAHTPGAVVFAAVEVVAVISVDASTTTKATANNPMAGRMPINKTVNLPTKDRGTDKIVEDVIKEVADM